MRVGVLGVGFGVRPEVGGGHPAPRRDVVQDDCTAAHGFLRVTRTIGGGKVLGGVFGDDRIGSKWNGNYGKSTPPPRRECGFCGRWIWFGGMK